MGPMVTLQGAHTISVIRNAVSVVSRLQAENYYLDFFYNGTTPKSDWSAEPRLVSLIVDTPHTSGAYGKEAFSKVVWKLKSGSTEKTIDPSVAPYKGVYEINPSSGGNFPCIKIAGNPFTDVFQDVSEITLKAEFAISIDGTEVESSATIAMNKRQKSDEAYYPIIIRENGGYFEEGKETLRIVFKLGRGSDMKDDILPRSAYKVRLKDWSNGNYSATPVTITESTDDSQSYECKISATLVNSMDAYTAEFTNAAGDRVLASKSFELYDRTDEYTIYFKDTPGSTITYGMSVTTTCSVVKSKHPETPLDKKWNWTLDYMYTPKGGKDAKRLKSSATTASNAATASITVSGSDYQSKTDFDSTMYLLCQATEA